MMTNALPSTAARIIDEKMNPLSSRIDRSTQLSSSSSGCSATISLPLEPVRLGPTVARNSKGDSEDKKDDEVAVSDSEVNEASTNCDVIGRMVGVVAAAVEMWLVNVAGCRWLLLLLLLLFVEAAVVALTATNVGAAVDAAVMGNVIVVARRSATLTPDISSISQPD